MIHYDKCHNLSIVIIKHIDNSFYFVRILLIIILMSILFYSTFKMYYIIFGIRPMKMKGN